MKIKSIELNNFKFHKNLEFNINKENCLIYGENGVGKSSIYWGLYSIFYKDLIDISDYKTYGSTTPVKVEIKLDDLSTINTNIESSIIDENLHTIYFAHQDFLEEITIKKNFYEVIENSLKNSFPILNSYIKEFDRINSDIDETNDEEEAGKRLININSFSTLLDQLNQKANDIIQNHFDENFSISFDVDWGISQLATKGKYTFSKPKISIKIDNKENLKLNFNEAKLKLTSLAIFFALIKQEESNLKLLVLDDFLTSLDMANRKLIIQYILDNFEEYQKIIMTHNIQFYNMIVRFLKSRGENENWDIKNIFLHKENNHEVAIIADRNEDYLSKAEDELNSYHLEVSGNFLRKEFERIVNEFEQLLELGRVEELDNVIKALNKLEYLFPEPSKNLKLISTKFNNIIANESTDDTSKYQQLKVEIEEIPTKLRFRNSELSFLKQTILKTEFYKNILMNSASHDDTEKELYRKEFKNSIKLLKDLNKILKNLK